MMKEISPWDAINVHFEEEKWFMVWKLKGVSEGEHEFWYIKQIL
jgi:hypothetical protein